MYPGTYGKTQPDKLAAVHPATGETLTYRQLDERSNQLAQALHAAGMRPGGHVALMLENSLTYLEVMAACMRAGLYLTPINWHLSAPESAYIVEDCGASVLIASAGLATTKELGELAPQCALKLSVGGSVEGFEDYHAALARHPAEPLAEERVGSYMFYSSGTTGRPKGVLRPLPDMHPADGNLGQNRRIQQFGITPDSVFLLTAPLYHAAPLGYAGTVTQAGAMLVVMDRFDAETALRLIEEHKVTHSQWVPTMFVRMLKLPEEVRACYDLSSHRVAIHAAAPCPIEVKRAMIDWWGPILLEYYSSTEGAGMALIASEEWLAHPGSVGKAQGQPYHVCDEAGNELPAGEIGLIYGETVAGLEFEYHNDPDKTGEARHPTRPDWIAVGDIGYLDAEGYLYLTDRKAFMIVSGGVNIYPQQIEDALVLHPAVDDVAVIGVPNPDLGEEAKAVVQPAPGVAGTDELARELIDFAAQKLGRQLSPRSVDFVEELPRMPTGKLAKRVLREKYWGEQAGKTALASTLKV